MLCSPHHSTPFPGPSALSSQHHRGVIISGLVSSLRYAVCTCIHLLLLYTRAYMHMPHPRLASSSPGTHWDARASRTAYCLWASKTLAGDKSALSSPNLQNISRAGNQSLTLGRSRPLGTALQAGNASLQLASVPLLAMEEALPA